MSSLSDYSLVYLATPYSRWRGGIEDAFVQASRLAARMLASGIKVYSSIAHTHSIAIHGGLDPLDHRIWLPFDESMMTACSALAVAHMDGWRESVGIAHEVEFFGRVGKPIFDLDPETLEAVRR